MPPKAEVRDATWVEKRIKRDASGCWIWQKSLSRYGYGKVGIKALREGTKRVTKLMQAHRHVYEILVGEIPPGVFLCHRCDVRACVNPEHLFFGDALINNRDARAKGRSAIGERSGTATLTAKDVVAIRRLFKAGAKQAALAKRFGVQQSCISRVIRVDWGGIPADRDRVPRKRFSREEAKRAVATIHELRRQGLSFAQIAEHTGLEKTTVFHAYHGNLQWVRDAAE